MPTTDTNISSKSYNRVPETGEDKRLFHAKGNF